MPEYLAEGTRVRITRVHGYPQAEGAVGTIHHVNESWPAGQPHGPYSVLLDEPTRDRTMWYACHVRPISNHTFRIGDEVVLARPQRAFCVKLRGLRGVVCEGRQYQGHTWVQMDPDHAAELGHAHYAYWPTLWETHTLDPREEGAHASVQRR